jgi:hypothetical protein
MFHGNAITGPTLVNYFEWFGRHVYLIGEEHGVNGKGSHHKDYVLHHLLSYCKDHKVRVYLELTSVQVSEYRAVKQRIPEFTTPSPMYGFAEYFFPNRFLNRPEVVFCDKRKVSPYDMYMLLIDPEIYTMEHFQSEFSGNIVRVEKIAKQAEKAFMKHLSTRKDAIEFLESLYLPDQSYPRWFKALYKNLFATEGHISDDLRDMMKSLRDASDNAYAHVLGHFRSLYASWNVEHVENMRMTADSKVVAKKNARVREIFIDMTNFIIEIYVILDLILRPPPEGETVVVFAGVTHTANIGAFLHKQSSLSSYKYGPTGNIPSGQAHEGMHQLFG